MDRAYRLLPLVGLAMLAACGGRQDSGSTAAPAAPERVVNFYSWVDEIGPNTASDFEKRTAVRVNTIALSSNLVMETQLLTGHSGYDVVEPSVNFVQPLIAAGALLKLDKSRLSNWKNLDPALLKQIAEVDPGNEYTIPFLWGTHGIGMNTAAVTAALGGPPPKSWRLFYDPAITSKLRKCGMVWAEPGWMSTAWAKLYLHRDPNSESEADLSAAEQVLRGTVADVRYIDNYRGDGDLASGEICIEHGQAGSILQAQERANQNGKGIRLEYFIPEEGAMLWFDMLAIPADAPHVDDAYRFLDYLLEPQVIADVTNATLFANANRAATPLVREQLQNDERIYPSPETFRRLHVYRAHSQGYNRLETRMWTRVRTDRKPP